MTIDRFVTESGLAEIDELARACRLAFYHQKKNGIEEFCAVDCAKWSDDLRLGKPNTSRLSGRLKNSRDTVRGSKPGYFRLHHNVLKDLETQFPQLAEKSQEVMDDGTILPAVLYGNTRGYIESLAKQINASYEYNIFDGCAVLMRRVEEVLLILSYEHLKIDGSIRDANGNYMLLEAIVRNAAGNATLSLSRNSKKSIETIRQLGNFSAHKVTYTCKREYVKENINEFRALVDELLHKAGIRK